MDWFIVHTTPNYEKKVKERILDKAKNTGQLELISNILVPEEEVISMKNGKKVISSRRLYPSYIFIEMEFNEMIWHLIKKVPNVTGFVGGDSIRPAPMPKKDIEGILRKIEESKDKKPVHKIEYAIDEIVRIKDGPFTDFQGKVISVNYERNKLSVTVTVFGRETPLEVDFSMVEKT